MLMNKKKLAIPKRQKKKKKSLKRDQQNKNTDVLIEHVRHSLAHLLAAAVRELFPGAKNAIGPSIENGFYQDFELSEPISQSDLPRIEETMRKLMSQWNSFKRSEVTLNQALKEFSWNEYKLELVQEFAHDAKKITFYTSGSFIDLCKGGHVNNPSTDIDPQAFKLDKVAGAYWRGNEKNKMLTRIYGLAFRTKQELDDFLKMREEAERRDHKKLGAELDLFFFSDLVGSGLPLWTPKGTILRDLLSDFVWELRKAHGYEKVEIPHITRKELYEKSGHWDKYKDDLFKIFSREHNEYALKPMNCPHHTQIYNHVPRSYRDLPQRYANTTMVYRDEQTGELSGLSRVECITQDDAHVFCRQSQIKSEFLKVWGIVHRFYKTFGFTLRLRLSMYDPKQSEKYLGDKKRWMFAQDILREIAVEKHADYFEGIGEAAFYGPKLDFMAKDAIGREHQVATIQLDMNMPERFNLTCINEKGEPERIVMIHAAIMGSIERFLSVLIEHYAGEFPLWLAPVQIQILAVSAKHDIYAEHVAAQLTEKGIRIRLAATNETLGKRIREAELMKIPCTIIVGDKEIQGGTVSVRRLHSKDSETFSVNAFIDKALEEIRERK